MKTILTWLWQPRGGWREGAGYTPQIVAGVDYMLKRAIPDVRHVCIADEVFRPELDSLGIESFPLWDIHGKDRLSSHGFDCYMRLGLWGAPGAALAEKLGDDIAQWTDIDVMIRPTAGACFTFAWRELPEVFWIPRNMDLETRVTFGDNQNTWLGVNGSLCRLRLGSRPAWWKAIKSDKWRAETEAYICGSDQAALTRLALEQRKWQWREPNKKIFELPKFGPEIQAHGMWATDWQVAYFPYDLDTDYTKPWLSANAFLRREYRVLAGLATEAEIRATTHPGLRRFMGKKV